MTDFDIPAFEEILESYAENMERFRDEERYKWEAVQCFQKHWDPEAKDFASMLKVALSKTDNLLKSGKYYNARDRLLEFAREYPAETRDALLALLEGNNPLQQRLKDFRSTFDSILELVNAKQADKGKQPESSSEQSTRAVSVYLALAHPDKHFLYMSEMYRNFAKIVGVETLADQYEKVIAYYDLMQSLLDYIEAKHSEFIEKSDSLLEPQLREYDPNHHILVQDIVYYATKRHPEAVNEMKAPLNEADDKFDTEFATIDSMIEESSPIASNTTSIETYGHKDFLNEVYIDADDLDDLIALLERKKNVILQGAPGTGKTFAAKRLCWCTMNQKDDSHIKTVQFHQSTSYEDMVYGYKPNDDGGFSTIPGTFVSFCRKAEADPDKPWFFIIDEINRANISKVLGELLMLIEADHRGEAITLTVSGERFAVPQNVYIIGMMNTADRGLALIDYALRRRFAFFEMEPALDNPKFVKRIEAEGERMKSLVQAVRKLNALIAQDPALGSGFRIGQSYFCVEAGSGDTAAPSIVKYELAPLIEEYWFDDTDRIVRELSLLEDAIR